MKIIKLTAMEREILFHRLDVSSAIAEVFKEDHGIDEAITLERVEILKKKISANRPYVQPDDFEMMILKDCCDGCTLFGSDEEWDISYQKKAAYYRAAKSLGEKIGTPVITF